MALAGCPRFGYVGCDRKPPQTLFLAGPDKVAVRHVEGCTFELPEEAADRRFPNSDDGFYSVSANEYPQDWSWVSYDAGTPPLRFTISGRECDRGISKIDVEYYRWMRTVHE